MVKDKKPGYTTIAISEENRLHLKRIAADLDIQMRECLSWLLGRAWDEHVLRGRRWDGTPFDNSQSNTATSD